jgi:C-terminal processing protease CtpA/Prc
MKRLLVIVIALVVLAGGSYAGWVLTSKDPVGRLPRWVQLRPSLYLDTALDRIQANAYGRATIEWTALRADATQMAAQATTSEETYGAIRSVLDKLPDHLSLLVPPPATTTNGHIYGLQVLFPDRVVATVYPGSAAAAAGIQPGDTILSVEGHPPMANRDVRTRGYFIDLPPPETTLRVRTPGGATRDVPLAVATYSLLPAETHRVGPDVGYVRLPGTSGAGGFVEAVQAGIARADAPTVCGWIVDLRANTGGSLWPMLQAIRAIVGEAPIGSSVDAAGTRTPWAYPTPAAGLKPLDHPQGPVAVLTSRLTAGAAEGVVVAMRGRTEVHTFGEPTWGTPTTSQSFVLADNAVLQITQAFDADRSGVEYQTRIPPDQPMPIDWARLGAADDPMVVAAGTWIRGTCGKRN